MKRHTIFLTIPGDTAELRRRNITPRIRLDRHINGIGMDGRSGLKQKRQCANNDWKTEFHLKGFLKNMYAAEALFCAA
jgi:hypothetical protein